MWENYSLTHFAGICGGWVVIWLTYAVGQRRITLRMLFALLLGFGVLFAMSRTFIKATRSTAENIKPTLQPGIRAEARHRVVSQNLLSSILPGAPPVFATPWML